MKRHKHRTKLHNISLILVVFGSACGPAAEQLVLTYAAGTAMASSPTPDYTDTPAPTATSTLTPTRTSTPTSTATPEPILVTLTGNAFCRSGPGEEYTNEVELVTGDQVVAVGVPEDDLDFVIVMNPDDNTKTCWLSLENAEMSNTLEGLTAYPVPPIPRDSSISGIVWKELCYYETGNPDANTCKSTYTGGCCGSYYYAANNKMDPNEKGIANVVVDLSLGECVSGAISDILTTAITGGNGYFFFGNLAAGDYCVSVNSKSYDNRTSLGGGRWTIFPGGIARFTVHLSISGSWSVAFGWGG